MKKKDQWMLVAVVALALVGGVWMGYIPLGTTGAGTPGQPITLQENKAAVTAMCFDETGTVVDSKLGGTIALIKAGQADGKETTESDGTVSYDINAGYVSGDQITVRCMNNTDDGFYRNEVQKTLVIGENTIAVPVKRVGDYSVTASTAALTVGASEMKSIDLDISANTLREYIYKPVIACSGESGTLAGEVKTITVSGFTTVPCDPDVASAYTWCNQLDNPEYLSTSAIVDDAKFWVEATSTDPAGNLNCSIYDGVPYGGAGIGSINRANAYDSDGPASVGTFSIVIS